ncbi:MAG: hypothetical protein GPJ52_04735 [Candidatus Heimdallarchaeota archaeon]|nr:hypothetical protein [Candidatus Heimdallarchaeota archaeon]MCG3253206.1 hypothetical protein [Candidatus Heimdallarchaeota archaeon]MCK4290343.1 hypothetical protein [Candidatus Heimdallarchaeota archaeon]
MKYKEQLDKAEQLEAQGKNVEAAKIYENIGTKSLREEGEERKAAPKIIAKSIARYILAGKITQAQDLAFQVLFMKDEDPFLSLQIETAISSKTNVVRGFLIKKFPTKMDDNNKTLLEIPQNRKVMKIEKEVTIKKMWEQTIYGEYKEKFDLLDQKYPNPKEMINFILSTKTGINIVGGETLDGQKILVLIAATYNDDPIEVIDLKTS